MFGKMSTPITTLMLRNLPRAYTQDQLLREIQHAVGSKVDFDFLYVPWDSRNRCNAGYAFMNCCDAEGAEWCRGFFGEYYFCRSAGHRPCAVFPAHIQGLESNLIHLAGTALGDLGKNHAPIIILHGQKLRFPQIVAALHQLPDAPAGQKPSGPGGGAVQQPWSASAPPPEGGLLEGLATRRQPASVPAPQMLAAARSSGVQKLWSGGSTGAASTRAPSSLAGPSEGRGGDSGSCKRTPGGSGGGADEDDDFSRLLAEVTLAKRIGAIMSERRITLPQAALVGSPTSPPSLAELFGDGGDTPPGAGIRPPPGLELSCKRAPASGPAAPLRQRAPQPMGDVAAGGAAGGSPARPPPRAAAGGPRVIEPAMNLNSRVFQKFFEKCSDDSGRQHADHTGSSTFGECLDNSSRQPADVDLGSLKVFSL